MKVLIFKKNHLFFWDDANLNDLPSFNHSQYYTVNVVLNNKKAILLSEITSNLCC